MRTWENDPGLKLFCTSCICKGDKDGKMIVLDFADYYISIMNKELKRLCLDINNNVHKYFDEIHKHMTV